MFLFVGCADCERFTISIIRSLLDVTLREISVPLSVVYIIFVAGFLFFFSLQKDKK